MTPKRPASDTPQRGSIQHQPSKKNPRTAQPTSTAADRNPRATQPEHDLADAPPESASQAGETGFVVNDSLEIVEFLGNTGRYLRIAPGTASLGLTNLLQSALQAPIARAVKEAGRSGHASVRDVSFLDGKERGKVDIQVHKSKHRTSDEIRYRVLIQGTTHPATARTARPVAKGGQASYIASLEKELAEEKRSSQANLASQTKRYEVVLERLQTANEELETTAARAEQISVELEETAEELRQALTESHQSERLSRESEQRFRMLANEAPVLIWTHGANGCEFVNREYLQFLGCSMEDVAGMGWARYIHPDDAAQYVDAYQTAFLRRHRFTREVRFRRADGEYFWFRAVGVPRYTSEETFLGYVGCTVDITDIKKSQAALEEADRRKDEFLAMLGHELRNPLAAIRTGTLLLQSSPPEERRRWIEQMVGRQVLQLERLVGDLLDVSRIARGKIRLEKEKLDIGECIEPAIEVAKDILDARGHKLSVEMPSEKLYVAADRGRIEQILINLLTNAAKYTPQGGNVWLSAEKRGDDVLVRCKDTGIGLAPEMLESIFEPFTQVNDTNDSVGSGLGIGLALVKTLAELHGGAVTATSTGIGHGSEFVLRLPAFTSNTPAVRKNSNKASGASGNASPLNVLLVDDNRDLAESTRMFLEAQGHHVRMAFDGATALSAAEQNPPDFVLLDIGMPDMDGHTVAARMRARPHMQGKTIIAVSGFKMDVGHGSRLFDAHLVKPFQPDELLELLQMGASRSNGAGILLIEDNQELAELTAELLRGHGQAVELALNGRDGIEKAKHLRPRIVLCDLNLPDVKGVEVARTLRREATWAPLMIVGVSAALVGDFQQHADESDFDLFWAKPFKWEQVRDLLHTLEPGATPAGKGADNND